MSMRISDAALAVMILLSACGQGSDDPRVAAGAVAEADADTGRIGCTLAGGAMREDCTVERATTPAGQMLTLRQPDGGFHRVLVGADGRGLAAADGAEPAAVRTLAGGGLEIDVGGDRYRLPATR